jgi:hypothetical protein
MGGIFSRGCGTRSRADVGFYPAVAGRAYARKGREGKMGDW